MTLLALHYLPKIEWFTHLLHQNSVLIEACDSYQKSSLRNRTIINAANGPLLLSIPIVGGRDAHQLYKNVQISYAADWQRQHWQSIQSAYGSAPFFAHYADSLMPFYEQKIVFLFDYNSQLLQWALKQLKIKKEISLTTMFEKSPLVVNDFRLSIHQKSEINATAHYIQVFSEKQPFNPNVSILDLLFNEGPNALAYLMALEQ